MLGDLPRSLVQPLTQSGHHNFVQPNLETHQEWRDWGPVPVMLFYPSGKKVIPEVQPELTRIWFVVTVP